MGSTNIDFLHHSRGNNNFRSEGGEQGEQPKLSKILKG